MKTKTASNSNKQRNSTIEVLRILCMLAIVAHHCVVHGLLQIDVENDLIRNINDIIIPGGKLCFITFIAISTWFLINSHFKAERFFKVWLETLFYNVFVIIIACIFIEGFADSLSIKNWIGSFFPIFGNSHGFVSAYLGFYLLLPVLHIVSNNLNKKQLLFVTVFLTLTQLFTYISPYFFEYSQPDRAEILLFVMCYFISLYLYRYPIKIQNSIGINLCLFLAVWAVASISRIQFGLHGDMKIWEFMVTASNSEFSFLNIIGGFSLFFIFNAMKPRYCHVINTIASTTLGILLIHDHNLFRHQFWFDVMDITSWANEPIITYYAMMTITVVIAFTSCAIIDLLRQQLEKAVMKTSVITKMCNKLDSVWISKPD